MRHRKDEDVKTRQMHGDRHLVADLVKGAVAGAAATWVMTQVTTWLYEREGKEAREQEEEARGDRSAYEIAAEEAAATAGIALNDDERAQAGTAIHWATGIAAGAAYAVMRRRWPSVAAAAGLPFGAGFFLLVDEVMNPVLGLTAGPQAFPWQSHGRGLAGHAAFGLATEVVLQVADRVAPR